MAAPASTRTSPWLARALVASLIAHAALGVGGRYLLPTSAPAVDEVDVELAPAAPPVEALPEEKERPELAAPPPAHEAPEPAPAATAPHPAEDGDAPADAAIDARPDAAIDARPDAARPDAAIDAGIDAAPEPPADALTVAAAEPTGSGSGSDAAGSGSGSGSDGSGASATVAGSGSGSGSDVIAAAQGSGSGSGSGTQGGSGSAGSDAETAAAVAGAPTTAGTAANLLAYFPKGHVITALIRFDRLRGTEWAAATDRLLRPLPDAQVLFDPKRDVHLSDHVDTLVISTPAPRDATATTLVAHTHTSRAGLRDLLAQPGAGAPPFTWSVATGGMLGRRALPRDPRVILAPFRGWFVLTQPDLLGGLTAKASGDIDKLEASGKLPPWLDGIREIEKETGADRGPALVMTFAGAGKRYKIPDIGLGVTALPAPQRGSLAAELVPQGWLVRGNILFASEAEATEFETDVHEVQQRVADSHLLQLALRRSRALNALTGLSIARTGDRVSYATSVSIADARGLLAFAAAMLADAFGVTTAP